MAEAGNVLRLKALDGECEVDSPRRVNDGSQSCPDSIEHFGAETEVRTTKVSWQSGELGGVMILGQAVLAQIHDYAFVGAIVVR